jgi:hypothetical protein
MAKADTVYSMFGMETPQQVAARRLKEQTTLMSQYQRDPFQSAGAAIGLGLMRLFGPEDQQMARAIQGQEIVTGARAEARQAEQAKAAELASFQERLRGAGGRTTREGQPLINLSAEEKLAQDQQKYYELYNTIADRLDAAGFPMEAENARTKASEQLLGSLSIRKQLADIGYTEAKTAAEGKGQWANLSAYILPDGTQVTGGTFNGQLAVQGADGKPMPMPPGSTKRPSIPQPSKTGALGQEEVFALSPILEADPIISELDDEQAKAVGIVIAARVDELIDQKKATNRAQAAQLAIDELKESGQLGMGQRDAIFGILPELRTAILGEKAFYKPKTTESSEAQSTDGIPLTEGAIKSSPNLQALGAKPGDKIVNGKLVRQ